MEKHFFAIDWSASIINVKGYDDFVVKLLNDHVERLLNIIFWADNTIHVGVKDIPLKSIDCPKGLHRNGTTPLTFVRRLKYLEDEKYHLHIVTDGAISDWDVDKCDKFMKDYNLFDNILSVKLYYRGKNDYMNLKFTNLFRKKLTSIQINDEASCSYDPGMDLKEITYDFLMKDESINAWVSMKLRENPTDLQRIELKSALTQKMYEIIRNQKKESALEPFFKNRQVDECVAYVRAHGYSTVKAEIQSKMSHVFKLIDGSIHLDSMKAILPTQRPSSPVEFEEEKLEEMPITCDISFDNIKVACFPIQERLTMTCSPDEAERMGRNPFDAFEFMEQNLRLVEPQFYDYSSTLRIVPHDISPFTRVVLKGYYLLPKDDDSIDFESLMKHNDYVLSALFVDKLPGVKIFWHVVFLYTLALKKEPFCQQRERFFDAIRYLAERGRYYVAFNPYEEPTFYEKLNVCFWYTAEICWRAFPDNYKNKYKSWENIEPFLQFYKDVFDPNFELPLQSGAIWWCWKYMYSPFTKKPKDAAAETPHPNSKSQQTQKKGGNSKGPIGNKQSKVQKNRASKGEKSDQTEKTKNETPSTFDPTHLLSHFYGHKDSKDGKQMVLFSDLPVTPPVVRPLAWAHPLGLETVMKVCKAYLTKQGGLSYEDFDVDLGREHKFSLKVYEAYSEEDILKMKHVSINPITCRPYVRCKESNLHWKQCVGDYDMQSESSFRMFQRYCEKKNKYPESVTDLMLYKKERLMNQDGNVYPVFHTTDEKCFETVMDCYKAVMKAIPVREYLARCLKYRYEEARLKVDDL